MISTKKKLQNINQARENLKSMNFSNVEEPKKASYSAFNDVELLLTPDHENLPGIDSDCNQLAFSRGESVRVIGEKSIMQQECEKLKIVVNEKTLQCVGKQGRVVVVEDNGANVRFENIG